MAEIYLDDDGQVAFFFVGDTVKIGSRNLPNPEDIVTVQNAVLSTKSERDNLVKDIVTLTEEIETIGNELVTCLARTEQLEREIQELENDVDDEVATVSALITENDLMRSVIANIKYQVELSDGWIKNGTKDEIETEFKRLVKYMSSTINMFEEAQD